MATYSYGSSGTGVKELQQMLNAAGYNLDTDGIFGAKTQAAVKDYQASQGLKVDGIAGTNTLGSLSGSAQPQIVQPTVSAGGTVGGGGYSSKWQDQVDALYQEITNRKPFTYNPSNDQAYNAYRDLMLQQGKRAMRDTQAQAAALTGGYGSSYAQNAGQQAFDEYVTQITGAIPDFQADAYARWKGEGDDLMKRYQLAADREAQDYARYQNAVAAAMAAQQQSSGGYSERDSDDSDTPVSSITNRTGKGWVQVGSGRVSASSVDQGLKTGYYTAVSNGDGTATIKRAPTSYDPTIKYKLDYENYKKNK